MKIRINAREAIFPKRHKLQISSLILAGLAGSGVKIRFNPRVIFQHKGPKLSFH